MDFTMKILLITSMWLFISSLVYGQNVIRGQVLSKESSSGIEGVLVVLLTERSMLYKFTRSDSVGGFEVANVEKGKYIIQITSKKYADYIDTLVIDENSKKNVNIGVISLPEKAVLLENIIVKGKPFHGIRIKGDTTEFTADSFKVNTNSKVEDLLKVLPGISVDNKGKIFANGQQVKKVLVDEEEFFGKNPLLVTRNVRADMVDKVQLYDRASPETMLTGIDNGDKTKTINLQIKKEKKNLIFGKAEVGVGTKHFYNVEGMLNKFADNLKASIFGVNSNTGNSDITIGDNENLLGYQGQGLPKSILAGGHFDTKWSDTSKSKSKKINTDYVFSNHIITGENLSLGQTNLPSLIIKNNQKENYKNSNSNNELKASFSNETKNGSKLNILINAYANKSDKFNDLYQERFNGDTLINSNTRRLSSISTEQRLMPEILFSKPFDSKKKKRILTISASGDLFFVNSTTLLNSLTEFYPHRFDSSINTLKQTKNNNTKINILNFKTSYIEPLGKASSLSFFYFAGCNNSWAKSITYDEQNVITKIDSSFSSMFQYNRLQQKIGSHYNFDNHSIQINTGIDFEFTKFDLFDSFKTLRNRKIYTYVNPLFKFRYLFRPFHWIRFTYTGEPIQPLLNEIRPLINIENPIRIFIGNVNLKPSFEQKFKFDYMNGSSTGDQTFLINSTFTFNPTQITTNTVTNDSGIDTVYYLNNLHRVPITYNGFMLFNKYFNTRKLNFHTEFIVSGSKIINYSDYAINITDYSNYTLGIKLTKSIPEVASFTMGNAVGYNTLNSSLHKSSSNNYWSNTATAECEIKLRKIALNIECNYNYKSKTTSFPVLNYFLFNAWVSWRGINDQLVLKLKANDIFKQNIGFERLAHFNYVQQNQYLTISRYFIISLAWELNKLKKNEN